MRLQTFTMQGFKTFPDKTSLTVENGVTAVVGPNGSGKSNIGEALRWVLGEQNPRALRCEKKMEELIFHGTEARSPVGFAEVSLCLDNSDHSFDGPEEITVTRRLYRSGESEYYLGKSACRLKDIQELLMDTGLGQDGYSIIGQGMVKKIISDKSGDRRHVFEEACGISKYRHRKEESERKLANAQMNLLRVQDKIDELQPQSDSLGAQAEVARRYLLLRDELRGHEINLWLEDLDRVRASFTPLRDGFRAAKEQSKTGQETLAALYTREEAHDAVVQDTRIAVEQAQTELSRREEAAQTAESRLAVIAAEIIHHEENIHRIEQELEQSSTRSGGLDAQTRAALTEKAELMARRDECQNEITALYAEAERVAAQSGSVSAQIDRLRLEEGRLLEELQALRVHQASSETQRVEWGARRQTLLSEIDSRTAAAAEAQAALEIAEKHQREAGELVAELENVLTGYQLRKQSRQKRADEAQSRVNTLELERNTLSTRHHVLHEQEKEHQGFGNAVRTVLNEDYSFVRGTVADLIRVDGRYTVAVETALGGALQNIVVDTEDNAKTCVNILKQRSAGRATFLPLSSVTGRVMDEPKAARGYIGVASELVGRDERYDGILRFLLGRTAVVETLDDGIKLARDNGYRFRIVTLDGQVLNAGGSITGGSVARSTGLLSRKNELAELEQRLEELSAALNTAHAEWQTAARELSGVTYDLEVALSEQRAAQEQLAGYTADYSHRETFLAGHKNALKELENERFELDARLAGLQDTRDGDAGREQTLQAAIAALRQETEALSGGQESLSEATGRLSSEMLDKRTLKAELEESIRGRDRTLQELERLKQEMSGDEQTRRDTLKQYHEKKAALLTQQQELQSGRADSGARVTEQQTLLRGLYQKQSELDRERVELSRAIKEQSEENARLAQEVARMENKIITGEAEEKAISDRLWETYELTYSTAAEQRTEMESRAKTARRVAELKKEISSLGNPNIGAIEAYAEISERLELLTTQFTDADSAKRELEKIIDELTAEMIVIFRRQFSMINEHFGQTFADIFGGGQAHLELLDEDDPLGCDIEIKSQPPGKKLRSISLLSGGETSLTAIALYFAIFKVRPAPFCLLDEIDHDLDETNVERFARYLKRLGQQNQYIVITHRRGTMEHSSMLYGVTTQEAGVSKVLALRFEDAERFSETP